MMDGRTIFEERDFLPSPAIAVQKLAQIGEVVGRHRCSKRTLVPKILDRLNEGPMDTIYAAMLSEMARYTLTDLDKVDRAMSFYRELRDAKLRALRDAVQVEESLEAPGYY